MTSHQFAKELLAGPDLFIMVPKVKEYSDNEEDCCAVPSVSKQEGHNNITDQPCEVLVISYQPEGGRRVDARRIGSGARSATDQALRPLGGRE